MTRRLLKRNDSTASATTVIAIAIETKLVDKPGDGNGQVAKLVCGVARKTRIDNGLQTRSEVQVFYQGRTLWDYVLAKSDPGRMTRVVACGMTQVIACTGLLSLLESGEWVIDFPMSPKKSSDSDPEGGEGPQGLFVVADPPVLICLRNQVGARIMLLDTQNWTDKGCDEIIEAYGLLENTGLPKDCSGLKPVEYTWHLAGAVLNFYTAWCNFVKKEELGMLRWTVGGQSMSAFRHRFMQHPIELHDDETARPIERAAHYGGLLYAFFVGQYDQPVWQFDVNSLYPHVMALHHFPRKLACVGRYDRWIKGPPKINPEISIAEVHIESHHNAYPKRDGNDVRFCAGSFVTTLAGPELMRAIDAGDVVGHKNWATYELAPLFRPFVKYFWERRQEYQAQGNQTFAGLCKSILVCLYGKWSQQRRAMVYRPDIFAIDKWMTWFTYNQKNESMRKYQSIGWQVFEHMPPEDAPNTFPAIAAFITSYGREYMRCLRGSAGSRNVLYQAIDSVIVTEDGLRGIRSDNWIEPDRIGKLKQVAHAKSCEINGLHRYRIGTKSVDGWHAGRAIVIAPGKVAQTDYERLTGLLSHKPEDGLQVMRVLKQRSDRIDHGYKTWSGWVQPWELQESITYESPRMDYAEA